MRLKIKTNFYDRNSVLDFGKYIGKTVHYILHHNPQWLLWASTNGIMDLDVNVLDDALEYVADPDKMRMDYGKEPYEYDD